MLRGKQQASIFAQISDGPAGYQGSGVLSLAVETVTVRRRILSDD
jgi:hypothetical protein